MCRLREVQSPLQWALPAEECCGRGPSPWGQWKHWWLRGKLGRTR